MHGGPSWNLHKFSKDGFIRFDLTQFLLTQGYPVCLVFNSTKDRLIGVDLMQFRMTQGGPSWNNFKLPKRCFF